MPPEAGKTVHISVITAFFAVLSAAGLAICVLAVRDYAHARDSRSWERIEGVVLSATEDGAKAIRYAYVAGGKAYHSDRATFATAADGGARLRSFSAGERIEVLVDPEDPAMSVLQPGGSSLVFAAITAAAALLVFIGIGGLVRTAINVRRAFE